MSDSAEQDVRQPDVPGDTGAAPEGNGAEGAPRRKGLRRGLRNLVASRRQAGQDRDGRETGRDDVEPSSTGESGDASPAAAPARGRGRRKPAPAADTQAVAGAEEMGGDAQAGQPRSDQPAQGARKRRQQPQRKAALVDGDNKPTSQQPGRRNKGGQRKGQQPGGKPGADRGDQRVEQRQGDKPGRQAGKGGAKTAAGGEDLFRFVISEQFDQEDTIVPRTKAKPVRELSADDDAPKLHKVLAEGGLGSRREMEELILQGRVSVNGLPAHIGQRILPTDQVRVNGKLIHRKVTTKPPRVLLYHKPSGEIVSQSDPEGRPTVFDSLPRIKNGKWVAVGRLDFNTEGLLIFTTSGDIANRFMHPRYGVEREYAVRTLGELAEADRQRLLHGIQLDDGEANFLRIADGGGEGVNQWYHVALTEGRNREVRRMFEAVGLTVSRLIRTRYGQFLLPRGLKRGRWQELDPTDVRGLMANIGLKAPSKEAQSGGKGVTKVGGRKQREEAALAGMPMHTGMDGLPRYEKSGGRGGNAGGAGRGQPDPMQTSMGYIPSGPAPLTSHTTKFGGGMGGGLRGPGAGGGRGGGRGGKAGNAGNAGNAGGNRQRRGGGEVNGNVMPKAAKGAGGGSRRPRGRGQR
ncbi:23S rRNA pseudouridine(2605) synthase RluB [Cupriavidus metallidurans]|uniref:Pseudouridine synthase n=1 Tax=Cupriavidus metallidurans (strain ATCC 43123 / DSM 2839 / NBRC 102507 / CH34) TaxID=266264 RepID=Q1LLR3_CUPMC|nr:pseudouridine synthase [Cupriavidus metallidurans]ABF08913.1 pseudouridine synthase, Rsu [Cupriavidus metallidurans CH34]AVA36127.1 23S rRNA pseudouridylate synthase B [Cupriavidus metallidurans]MDE4918406.1 pseudouridine synthase [Cupriavidus metallidurans]QGS30185.1 pseudouridine synthase [Cupriavidus metallidurans]UBM09755.1 pseudouridine synthase [Cupriavidus metallidurans]